jgi:hypothetical protein
MGSYVFGFFLSVIVARARTAMEAATVKALTVKKKSWELQRYALLSFKFQNIEKNLVIFTTESEIKRT